MPILRFTTVRLRPVVAETGPIGAGVAAPAPMPTPTPTPTPTGTTNLFVLKHGNFIDQINKLNRCFGRADIAGFAPDDLNDHITVAVQDNFIVEDGNSGRYCSGQVAWELKSRTQGYTYRKL